VDVLFLIDICLNFNLMFRQYDLAQGVMQWVSDSRRIARHYLSTWFFVDAFSVAVSGFDVYSVTSPDGGAQEETKRFKLLRVLRALRLIKLLRLMRASRIFTRCVRLAKPWGAFPPLCRPTLHHC
jgi:hypothetical protein